MKEPVKDNKDLQGDLDKLVTLGKKKGFLTYEDVNETLSDAIDSSVKKAGGHGGVGVRWKATPSIDVGVEGDYHLINTEGTKTKYITGQAGVTFNFGGTSK